MDFFMLLTYLFSLFHNNQTAGPSHSSPDVNSKIFNVFNYGAIGNGYADDTKVSLLFFGKLYHIYWKHTS